MNKPGKVRLTLKRAHPVAGFRTNLDPMIEQAKARTLARLGRTLTFEPDGRIQLTAANQQTLRSLSAIFLEELDRAGYPALLNGFTASFPGQLPDFRRALEAAGAPAISFSDQAKRALASQQVGSRAVLRGAVEQAATVAQSDAQLASLKRDSGGVGSLSLDVEAAIEARGESFPEARLDPCYPRCRPDDGGATTSI
jgi:hypothetical protein